MQRVLILGCKGQVGRALQAQCIGSVGWDRDEIDFANPEEAARRVRDFKPDIILNAAAYTAVDQAESEPDLAFAINAETPRRIAQVCKDLGAILVHYSTDYIFSGEGETPWTENDEPAPLSVYGRTKLEGEKAIVEIDCPHLILRTSWVYAREGQNFVRTMLKLGTEKEEIRVVNDQFGAPTYAPALATATLDALEAAESMRTGGTYHLCSSGVTTWHAFAQAIFENARAQGMKLKVKSVVGIPSRDYPTPAKRPSNSRLSTVKISQKFGVQMPHWNKSLLEFFRESHSSSNL